MYSLGSTQDDQQNFPIPLIIVDGGNIYVSNAFYPTALKGCRGFVFTHGVRMGGRAAGKVCPGCISETVRCRKLILGRDIG